MIGDSSGNSQKSSGGLSIDQLLLQLAFERKHYRKMIGNIFPIGSTIPVEKIHFTISIKNLYVFKVNQVRNRRTHYDLIKHVPKIFYELPATIPISTRSTPRT